MKSTSPVTALGLVADWRVSSKCDVHKPRETIVGFTLLGLTIAALSYAYAAFDDYTKPMNGLRFAVWTVSMILCPPQLLFTFCIDCEVIGWDGFIMFSIIGVLNTALYALIGFIVVSWRKDSSSQSREQEPSTKIQGD